MLFEILTLITNTAVLSVVGYVVYNYLKLKNKLYKVKNKLYKMDTEELLQDIEDVELPDTQDVKRERLSAIVAGGGSRQYLGVRYNSQT